MNPAERAGQVGIEIDHDLNPALGTDGFVSDHFPIVVRFDLEGPIQQPTAWVPSLASVASSFWLSSPGGFGSRSASLTLKAGCWIGASRSNYKNTSVPQGRVQVLASSGAHITQRLIPPRQRLARQR